MFDTTLARSRKQPMAGAFTTIYSSGRSLPIPGIPLTYRASSARTYRGKSDRSVTRPAVSKLGGDQPICILTESHEAICCRETTLKLPSLGDRGKSNLSTTKSDLYSLLSIPCFF